MKMGACVVHWVVIVFSEQRNARQPDPRPTGARARLLDTTLIFLNRTRQQSRVLGHATHRARALYLLEHKASRRGGAAASFSLRAGYLGGSPEERADPSPPRTGCSSRNTGRKKAKLDTTEPENQSRADPGRHHRLRVKVSTRDGGRCRDEAIGHCAAGDRVVGPWLTEGGRATESVFVDWPRPLATPSRLLIRLDEKSRKPEIHRTYGTKFAAFLPRSVR